MPESRRGFTMVELVVALMVVTILLTIAVREFDGTKSAMAVDGASDQPVHEPPGLR